MVVAAPKNTAILYVAAAAVLLFIIAFVHQQSAQGEELKSAITGAANKIWPFKSSGDNLPSFFEIAEGHGTDKVTSHHYEEMYEKYFAPLRHKKIKMFEIGLGCDMSYGPGASYYTWLDYFTNVELYFMEYNAECATKWAKETSDATIVTGDQADPKVLEKFMAEHGKDFDIIIDDGGHTMAQQMTSLQYLWKAIKPGGIYFVEDLETSFYPSHGGGEVAINAGQDTMLSYIQKLIQEMTYPDARYTKEIDFDDVENMVHIDCSQQVCAFLKREE